MTLEGSWKLLAIPRSELCLSKVLRCGQAFRWKKINEVWTFTTHNKIILLKQDDQYLHFSWIGQKNKIFDNQMKKQYDEETRSFVQDYFNLHVKLEVLYEEWSTKDELFKRALSTSAFKSFLGIRILRQDPWETLISFICSSNNNVKRISKMCDAVSVSYGRYINDYGNIAHYSFPTPYALGKDEEAERKLRELGFGYRAKFIHLTAKKLISHKASDLSIESLYNLRMASYEDSLEFLMKLDGVGPKVADCVCLMALDKHEVVPVDTHIYRVAIRDYKYQGPKNLKGTLSKKHYEAVRSHLINIFGTYAGWAQSVLFAADLDDFSNGINVTQIKESTKATIVKV